MYRTAFVKFELPIRTSGIGLTAEAARARKQLALPIRLAGLGLRSAVDTLDIAYLAAVVRTVFEDRKWWKENAPTEDNNFDLHLNWQNTIDIVAEKLPGRKHRHLYPASTNIEQFIVQVESAQLEERVQKKLVSEQPNLIRLQSELSMAASKLSFDELTKMCTNDIDIVRLKRLTNSASDSHVWLSAIPTDPTLMMSNEVMRVSIRNRLGLPPYDTMPSQCVCGVQDAFRSRPYHAFSCRSLRAHGTMFRHNLLLARLATWARRAGLFVEIEVTYLSSDSKQRPDIVITHGSTMLIIDVTIVDPLNKTNIARAGTHARKHQHNSSSESAAAVLPIIRMITWWRLSMLKVRKRRSIND